MEIAPTGEAVEIVAAKTDAWSSVHARAIDASKRKQRTSFAAK